MLICQQWQQAIADFVAMIGVNASAAATNQRGPKLFAEAAG